MAEWEKAARGPAGRIWPWGDTWRDGRANTEETGVGTTTPVGQYSSDGDSYYGAAGRLVVRQSGPRPLRLPPWEHRRQQGLRHRISVASLPQQ